MVLSGENSIDPGNRWTLAQNVKALFNESATREKSIVVMNLNELLSIVIVFALACISVQSIDESDEVKNRWGRR